MDIGRPRSDNIIEFSRYLARQAIPTGAPKPHRPNRGQMWRKRRHPADPLFDLTGPCYGEITKVIELGIRAARAAIDQGDKELAERIVAKIRRLPAEYQELRNAR